MKSVTQFQLLPVKPGERQVLSGGTGVDRMVSEPAAGVKHQYETPGWQRAQQHWEKQVHANVKGAAPPPRRKGPPTIEGDLVASSATGTAYKVGDAVRHDKFGPGTVAEIDGNKLTVDFVDAGRKRVVESFVSPG